MRFATVDPGRETGIAVWDELVTSTRPISEGVKIVGYEMTPPHWTLLHVGTLRYTGAALTSDLAWLIGAGFAPLVALGLCANFGLSWLGAYLLSGALGTLIALGINRAKNYKS